jgi:hypothetical protein
MGHGHNAKSKQTVDRICAADEGSKGIDGAEAFLAARLKLGTLLLFLCRLCYYCSATLTCRIVLAW